MNTRHWGPRRFVAFFIGNLMSPMHSSKLPSQNADSDKYVLFALMPFRERCYKLNKLNKHVRKRSRCWASSQNLAASFAAARDDLTSADVFKLSVFDEQNAVHFRCETFYFTLRKTYSSNQLPRFRTQVFILTSQRYATRN